MDRKPWTGELWLFAGLLFALGVLVTARAWLQGSWLGVAIGLTSVFAAHLFAVAAIVSVIVNSRLRRVDPDRATV